MLRVQHIAADAFPELISQATALLIRLKRYASNHPLASPVFDSKPNRPSFVDSSGHILPGMAATSKENSPEIEADTAVIKNASESAARLELALEVCTRLTLPDWDFFPFFPLSPCVSYYISSIDVCWLLIVFLLY